MRPIWISCIYQGQKNWLYSFVLLWELWQVSYGIMRIRHRCSWVTLVHWWSVVLLALGLSSFTKSCCCLSSVVYSWWKVWVSWYRLYILNIGSARASEWEFSVPPPYTIISASSTHNSIRQVGISSVNGQNDSSMSRKSQYASGSLLSFWLPWQSLPWKYDRNR